jgi:thiol-disulfide isomerase/thioredoxin
MITSKKWVLLASLLLYICMPGVMAQNAQTDGVQFTSQVSLEEIVNAAHSQNKNVLIDCYTTWCGPCRHMSTVEFPKKIMGDYFNASFLNYKEDMEKTTGLSIAKKFNITAYPTFLILDKDGNEISRIVGSMTAEEFIAKVKQAIKTGGIAAMKARFNKGDRSESFLFDYLKVLSDANEKNECSAIAKMLLKSNTSKILSDKKYRDVFMDYIDSPEDSIFQFALQHKNALDKTMKAGELQSKLDQCWLEHSETFYSKKDTVKAHFVKRMASYEKLMDKFHVFNKNVLLNRCYLAYSIYTSNWADCLARVKKENLLYEPDINTLYYFFYTVALKCKDNNIRKQTNELLKEQIAEYQKKENAVSDNSEEKEQYQKIVLAFQRLSDKMVSVSSK